MNPVVVWFRRDLRVDDHAAFFHASRSGAPVFPLFIFDKKLIEALPSDGAAFDFQAEALRELEDKLRLLGGTLLLRRGDALEVHQELLRAFRPSALYFNREYESGSGLRDETVERLYRSAGAEVHTFSDMLIHEPEDVLTGEGKPYVVFTPYANAWKKLPLPSPFGKPSRLNTPPVDSEPIPGAKELGRPVRIPEPILHGGESQALKRWKWFLKNGLHSYATARDLPAIDGTSRMSPYLRFGMISIRRMVEDVRAVIDEAPRSAAAVSAGKYLDELIWREFYAAVLFHFPRVAETNYRQVFDRLPWKSSAKHLSAWQEGRTGFPLVDAGMRQLNRTGWMHNRVRMAVASFLSKDLMMDWKVGERYFAERLLDIETASNNGGWQWSASTGVDPKPLRIFNPTLQAERYDPQGEYIRANVPELRSVPTKYIHAPHTMPAAVQQEAGCIIGTDYPAPIVDHASAAVFFKQAFANAKR